MNFLKIKSCVKNLDRDLTENTSRTNLSIFQVLNTNHNVRKPLNYSRHHASGWERSIYIIIYKVSGSRQCRHPLGPRGPRVSPIQVGRFGELFPWDYTGQTTKRPKRKGYYIMCFTCYNECIHVYTTASYQTHLSVTIPTFVTLKQKIVIYFSLSLFSWCLGILNGWYDSILGVNSCKMNLRRSHQTLCIMKFSTCNTKKQTKANPSSMTGNIASINII